MVWADHVVKVDKFRALCEYGQVCHAHLQGWGRGKSVETSSHQPIDRDEQDFLSRLLVEAREEAVRQHQEVRARLSRLLGSEFLLVHLPRMTWQGSGSPYYYGGITEGLPESARWTEELMAFSGRLYDVFDYELTVGEGLHRIGVQGFDSRRTLGISWLAGDAGRKVSARRVLRPILLAGGGALVSEFLDEETLPAAPHGPPDIPRLSALLQRGLP